jgi:hypothetical protein
MVGFRDLVGTGIAPVSKKTAVKYFLKYKYLKQYNANIGSVNTFFNMLILIQNSVFH